MAEDLCDTKLSLAIGGGYHSPATKTRHHCELKPAVRLHLWFPSCRNEEEEDEVEKTGSVDSKKLEAHKAKQKDEDRDDNHSMRKKLCLTKDQSTLLEERFCFNNSLTAMQKQELAQKLALRPRQVEVWFQNRRARTKLKQIEVDYQALKRWCMNLTIENKKLKRELCEVKAEQWGIVIHVRRRLGFFSLIVN